jgi:glutathione S-transferase
MLTFIAERLNQDYLLGPDFTVADAYLFVHEKMAFPCPILCCSTLRITTRPAVQRSLEEEKLA